MPTYSSLREKISAEKKERAERYKLFEGWAKEADTAGRIAAEAAKPRPMVVRDVMTGYTYPPVADGVCGFGWVTIHPGNSSFAIWAKKNLGASKAYGGGVQIWVSAYGQSYERKVAYARAFADVLQSHGIIAYGSGRLD